MRNTACLSGKPTSIKAGLAALPDNVDTIVLLAVDQPRPSWLIREVLESHKAAGTLISSPVFDGHGGHPLVFDGSLLSELQAITEDDVRRGICPSCPYPEASLEPNTGLSASKRRADEE